MKRTDESNSLSKFLLQRGNNNSCSDDEDQFSMVEPLSSLKEEKLLVEDSVDEGGPSQNSSTSWANQRLNLMDRLDS